MAAQEALEAPLKPAQISASAFESKAAGGFADFTPEKTVDGDLSANSSWRAEVKDDQSGQWIQYDLGAVKRIASVRLAFVKGEERVYRFDIELSEDGQKWTTAFSGKSGGKEKGFEEFKLSSRAARYLRVRGFGNSSEQFAHWINIVETQILSGDAEAQPKNEIATPRLLFRSGFEADSRIINQGPGYAELVGEDHSVGPPHNWTKDLKSAPLGGFKIQYQGGEASQRLASLEPDPARPANHALRFWVKHVNVEPNASWGGKARIQANIYENEPELREFTYRFRVIFPQDWGKLADSPKPMGWCILAEFWNDGDWLPTNFPFRFHLTLNKSEQGLFFGAHSDGQRGPRVNVNKKGKAKGTPFTGWEVKNEAFTIPLGEWMTGEIYVKEGKGEHGRFIFTITRADGGKTVIFDVHNSTCHPDDPAPNGFNHINPMKLYSSRDNVDIIREAGGVMQVYWDDFELWSGQRPE